MKEISILTVAVIVALVLYVLVGIGIARADNPQPYQYAIVQCSGAGTVAQVQQAEQVFDTQYGFDHKLITPEQWIGTFIARVNEFASSVGCPQVLRDDGTLSGALTLWYKIYVPNYTRYLRGAIP